MGTVYRAVHTLMDKPVAVKILRGDHAGDPEAVARFHREARSASRLDHEHCIRVTDFGQSEDLLFLAMELLDGESLGALIRRGPVPAGLAAAIAHAISEALAHAHEQGVIHRDLKPDNVFLARRSRQDVVKVLDFGLARIVGKGSGDPSAGPAITQAGMVFGTPEYMAPEQAESGPVDARTDLYALGVILYHMLTGELPFRAPSFLALLSKHVEEAPEPPSARRPDLAIPASLEAIALRCLEKRPEDRYQSAGEIAEALLPLAERPALTPSLPLPSVRVWRPLPAREGAADLGSAERETGPARAPDGQGGAEPSLMSGEVILPARRRGLALGLGALGLAAVGGIAALAITGSVRRPTPISATVAAPVAADPLAVARRMLESGDLDGASRVLGAQRAARDGHEVQELLGQLALQRGNRLGALAHLHRATKIAPEEAVPHARLASLLALIGQREAACREAHLALARDPRNAVAHGAHAAARCAKEAR